MTRPISLILLLALWVAVACAFPLTMAGCANHQKKAEAKKQEEERKHQQETTVNLGIVGQEAVNADEEIDKAEKSLKTGLQYLGENPPDVSKIQKELLMTQAHQQSVKGSLGKVIPGVRLAGKQALVNKKDYDAVTTRVNELLADQDKPLLGWTVIGIIVGGIIVVGSLAASIIAKSYTGLPWLSSVGGLAPVGWMLGGLSLLLRTYLQSIPQYRPLIGGVAAAAICFGIVLAVYKGWKHGKLKMGFAEVVATGEAVRARSDVPTDAIIEEAAKIQSPATTELVQKFKASNLVADAADVAAKKICDDAQPVNSAEVGA